MTLALVLLAILAVLASAAVFAGAADRFVAVRAERLASQYASAPLGQAAQVRVHGEPFLTQALRGRYDDVEVSTSGLQVGVFAGTTLRAHLVGAHLPLRDLLARRVSELPVEHVHGDLVLPYAELARISSIPGLRLRFRDGRLIASAALPVRGLSIPGLTLSGLGQLANVSGEAMVTLDAGGGVWLRVRNIAVAGITLPSLVLTQLLPTLAFAIPVPPLPYGLRLEQLSPTADGLRVSGSARDVVFRAAAPVPPDPTS